MEGQKQNSQQVLLENNKNELFIISVFHTIYQINENVLNLGAPAQYMLDTVYMMRERMAGSQGSQAECKVQTGLDVPSSAQHQQQTPRSWNKLTSTFYIFFYLAISYYA